MPVIRKRALPSNDKCSLRVTISTKFPMVNCPAVHAARNVEALSQSPTWGAPGPGTPARGGKLTHPQPPPGAPCPPTQAHAPAKLHAGKLLAERRTLHALCLAQDLAIKKQVQRESFRRMPSHTMCRRHTPQRSRFTLHQSATQEFRMAVRHDKLAKTYS